MSSQTCHADMMHRRCITDLLQSLLHFLKVCLLVKVRSHDLGNQRLQHIGKEEQQQTAHEAGQGLEDIPDMVIGVVFGVEAAHKQWDEERNSHKSPQRFLHMQRSFQRCY